MIRVGSSFVIRASHRGPPSARIGSSQQSASSPNPFRPMSDLPPPSPLSILVVDDETSMRKLMGTWLKSRGHTVFLAEDGVDAIAEFQRERFDLVITDYVMPHLGGDALAAAIKKLSPGTPVI